jgi:hypothetical protein
MILLKIGPLSLIVVVLISGGLTIRATSDVDRACINAIESLQETVGDHLARIKVALNGSSQALPDKPSPGDTWVLIAGDGMITGLDRDGRVTWHDSSCGLSDVPALTGFSPVPASLGDVIAVPEVVLGLTIVRAFELRPALAGALSEINLGNLACPKATLFGGIVAELGHGGYVAKVEKLGQILMQARGLNMQISRIDLRFEGQVIVTCDRTHSGYDKEV